MTAVNAEQLIGKTAVDAEGSKIGKIGQVYLDDQSGQPTWLTVSTGLFGTKESFAPLHGATPDGDDVRLAVTKDVVKDAPNVESDGHLEPDDEQKLYSHYSGVLGGQLHAGAPNDTTDSPSAPVDRDVAATGTPSAAGTAGDDASVVRSEERLQVGTEQFEAGRARLRKYVVTENVTQTVPVSHEEVRVVREPIGEGEAVGGAAIGEAETAVTLHAERPVVAKETVPVERVGLNTETVTEEQTVNEQVRKEQVDTDGIDGDAQPRS